MEIKKNGRYKRKGTKNVVEVIDPDVKDDDIDYVRVRAVGTEDVFNIRREAFKQRYASITEKEEPFRVPSMHAVKKYAIDEAKEKDLTIVRWGLIMQFSKDAKLGYAGGLTLMAYDMARKVWDAIYDGALRKRSRSEQMLVELMDGVKGPHEINEQTGIDMERCEEIYKYYEHCLDLRAHTGMPDGPVEGEKEG